MKEFNLENGHVIEITKANRCGMEDDYLIRFYEDGRFIFEEYGNADYIYDEYGVRI